MFFSFQYLSMGLVFPVDTCRFVNRSSTAIIKADTSVVFFCKDLFRSENFGGDMRMKLRGTHEQCFKKWSIQGNGGFDVLYCSSREQLERKDTNLGNNLRQEYSEHYGSLERQACGEHTGVLFPGEGTGTKRQKQQGKTAFSQMDLIKSTSNRKNAIEWLFLKSGEFYFDVWSNHLDVYSSWMPEVRCIWQWVGLAILKVSLFQSSDSVIPRKEQENTWNFALL